MCIRVCSKKIGILKGPTCWSCSFVSSAIKSCYFMFLFQLLFPLCYSRLNCPLWIPLKILYEKPELSTIIINIITFKPRGPYLPLSRGWRNSGLGGCVCSVKFGNPLPIAVSLAINQPPHNMPVPIYPRKDFEQGLILRGTKCQAAPSSHVQKTNPRLVITIFKCTSSNTRLNGCSPGDLFTLICRHTILSRFLPLFFYTLLA